MKNKSPWHIEQDPGDHLNRYVVREAGRVVADRLFADDARLIAAAPEMLDYIKATMWHWGCSGTSKICNECGRDIDLKHGPHTDQCRTGALLRKIEGGGE